jgi:hypothetical protein
MAAMASSTEAEAPVVNSVSAAAFRVCTGQQVTCKQINQQSMFSVDDNSNIQPIAGCGRITADYSMQGVRDWLLCCICWDFILTLTVHAT